MQTVADWFLGWRQLWCMGGGFLDQAKLYGWLESGNLGWDSGMFACGQTDWRAYTTHKFVARGERTV